jgi:hypothetical protein
MSRITLAPNASGSGTLTVAAPNTNTDRTITLPDVTTTLVGTDATQTLTNKTIGGSQLTGSVASSLLTGALPAIDGSALTGIVTGGMTLLGTMTTTSGTSQVLSGLVLTSYKMLMISYNQVSTTSTGSVLQLSKTGSGALSITNPLGLVSNYFAGITWVSLVGTNGAVMSAIGVDNAGSGSSLSIAGYSDFSTATTSITLGTGGGNFDSGTVTFYGMK